MPFSVLVGAMSCYLNAVAPARTRGRARRRRLRLAIRGAGDDRRVPVRHASPRPIYNPISATLQERSKRLEAEMLGESASALQGSTSGFWVRQKSADGAAIINAKSSREQGAKLGGVTRLYLRQPTAISSSGSRPKRHAGRRLLAARRRAHLRQRQAARGRGHLPAQHQPDARTGARELRDARNGAVLATAHLTSRWRTAPASAPRVTGCNITNCWRVRSCSPPW